MNQEKKDENQEKDELTENQETIETLEKDEFAQYSDIEMDPFDSNLETTSQEYKELNDQ